MAYQPREQHRERPEVHVAGVCLWEPYCPANEPTRILLARRSSERKLYPGRWEGCGGQLAANETFAEGVVRHFLSEMHLPVRVHGQSPCVYEIRTSDGVVIPGLRFLCERAGDAEPYSANHTELRWLTLREIRELPDEATVPGIKEDIRALLGIGGFVW
jgi:ADP-ribose pyrophosphatase YjhB (NUDIX family)